MKEESKFHRNYFMLIYFWIGLGSALGGIARYWVSIVIDQRFGETFPLGTLVVNVTGSFLIGLLATSTGHEGRIFLPPIFRQFLMIGICGGYTTFSSFSLQTLTLIQNGDWLKAGANTFLSVILCLVAVWLGHLLAMSFNQLKGH